jgi:hypothetical protein
MIQRNEADVPEMLTEPGKWLDGDTLLFKGTSETRLGESPIIIDILKGLLISMPLWPATSVLEH